MQTFDPVFLAIERYEEWLKRLDQELQKNSHTIPKRGKHTREEWEELKRKYDYTCPCCNRREPEIVLTRDHIVPRSFRHRGFDDLDDIRNIQPLCENCNRKKGNREIRYSLPEAKLAQL